MSGNVKKAIRSWANEEKFFARSWTHVFYFLRLRQIMLGRTVERLLTARKGGQMQVIDLGCGPGTNLFEVIDRCVRFSCVEWYGLDLNQQGSSHGC